MAPPLPLLLKTSSTKPVIKPFSAYLQVPIKIFSRSSGGSGHGVGKRAPSTAEEFERVAAEKRELQRSAEEKAGEAAGAAVSEDSDLETVKYCKYKDSSGSVDQEPKRKGDH